MSEAARNRYRPAGLEHIGPRDMLTSAQMQKAFRVGGITPQAFIGRCAREGRAIKVYRCARGVQHFRFGEIVARANAQNLEVTPLEADTPETRPPEKKVLTLIESFERDPLKAQEIARQFVGRSLRSGREIAEFAAKSGGIEELSGVYFLVHEGKVVYVGQSYNVHGRVAAHKRGKTFDSWCYVQCTGRRKMNMLESLYIHYLQPEQNGRLGGSDVLSVPMDLKTILKAAEAVA